MNEDSTKTEYGVVVWIPFIFCFVFGLIMQLTGLVVVSFEYGGSFYWWAAHPHSLQAWPIWIYNVLTPVCFILLSLYLYTLRKRASTVAVVASLSSIGAGLLWTVFYFTYYFSIDLFGVALSIFYWSGSIMLFGITFFLVGIIYLNGAHTTLTRVTGLSFLVTGLIGVIVGYSGGFTFIPWFTIYDFPWVTGVAVFPCCLALIVELQPPSPVMLDKEGISLE